MKSISMQRLLSLGIGTILLFSCGTSHDIGQYAKSLELNYVQYASEATYSRAIQVSHGQVFLGNSDGFVYRYDLKSKEVKKLNAMPYPEIRDLFVPGKKGDVIATQSADTSVVIYLGENMESTKTVSSYPLFIDAMDMNTLGHGFFVADPVNGFFQVYYTFDMGKSWSDGFSGLKAAEGEAAFAASGSIAQMVNDSTYFFASGGKESHLFESNDFGKSWESKKIPFDTAASSGAFSIFFWNAWQGVVVGGDYLKPNDRSNNCWITKNGGRSWFKPKTAPGGYRSQVIWTGKALYASGTNGIDISLDRGLTWTKISDERAYAMTYERGTIYATTKSGKFFYFKAI
ncbi:MAG: hypothetical protein EP338_07590 [Bacteroidetes bacterium]|nr:MAG: hypothetical protein EP338_07590 [Bacteroidota bacterium]